MFESHVEELLDRGDAKAIEEYLAYYHELDSCCEGKDHEAECEFAVLRKKLKQLNTLR